MYERQGVKMDLLRMSSANEFSETGEVKKISIEGKPNSNYKVYSIPLKYLYYNDQNGRINTLYKKYSSINGLLKPEPGDSEYNRVFEEFIFESNSDAMKETIRSITTRTGSSSC